MWLRRFLIFVAIGIGNIPMAAGQCPTVDFNSPATVCINQNFELDNNSGTGTYQWDFCTGELNTVPQVRSLVTLPGVNGLPGIELVWDGNKWFGFATGTNSNVLYRMEFQNGTNQAPTFVESLGTLSGKLNGPSQIRIINENSLWYGFVVNTASDEILKLEFGDKLSNVCTASILASGIGDVNTGLALGKDPIHGWTCVVSSLALNKFTVIRIGNTLASPTPSDIIVSGIVPNPNSLGDIDLINVCGSWVGFADNLGNGNVYRLDFGTNLFSDPVITQIISIPAVNPGRLRIVKDGEEYFLLIVDLGGTVTKLKFGADLLSTPVVVQEGNIGGALPANIYGIGVAKDNSIWTIHVVNASNGAIYQIDYLDNCSASPKTSTEVNPQIQYASAGDYTVTLETENASGIKAKSKLVQVSSNTSPDIDFTTQNICVNHDINFTSQNTSGNITGYDWDFGDTNSSTQPNPIHQYTSDGEYQIELEVTASNGCKNFTRQSLTTYNEPIADFTTPSASPVCTNQNFIFDNTTTFDAGYVPAWEWRINGSLITTNEDLTYTFSTTSNQEIHLKTSIPGCENKMIKNLNSLVDGPIPDFSFAGQCEEEDVTFTNNSTGTISGYSWDFDDGQSSIIENPVYAFSDHGVFDVTLTVSNIAGCNNSTTKAVTIYSKPQVNFEVLAPPFSCNGSPTEFRDRTPNPTDSNLSSWQWNFGDAGSSQNASTLKNPQHVYDNAGLYNVSLTVFTNFLCSSNLQLPITISQAPVADFSYSAPCEDVAVDFSDGSTGTIDSWEWQIGSTTYTTENPTHTFANAGNANATLTITASNDCIGSISKPIVVPAKLIPDFTVSKNCVNQETLFSDITNDAADPINIYQWEVIGGATATGSPAVLTFSTTSTPNVKLVVTTQTGCEYSVTKPVTIISSPTANFTANPEIGESPLVVQFTNTSVNATTYQWAFNDALNSTSAETSPLFTYIDFGQYQVELTAFNAQNCSHTFSSVIEVTIVTDVDPDLTQEQSFIVSTLYPNPSTSGELNVNWILKEDGIVSMKLINGLGQIVKDFQFDSVEGLNLFTLNTTGIGSGVYFIKFNYEQITKVYRVIISE